MCWSRDQERARSVEAISAYRAARRLLPGDPVGQARLMYREARIALRLGRYPQALRMITRALGTLGDRSGPAADAVRAELATRYGFCRHLQGRPDEALRWSTLGARWAEASGDVEVIAHAYNALHLVHGASSVPEDQPYGRLALAAYEGLGDLGGDVRPACTLGASAGNPQGFGPLSCGSSALTRAGGARTGATRRSRRSAGPPRPG